MRYWEIKLNELIEVDRLSQKKIKLKREEIKLKRKILLNKFKPIADFVATFVLIVRVVSIASFFIVLFATLLGGLTSPLILVYHLAIIFVSISLLGVLVNVFDL